jgi:hypothetical protein
LDDLRRPDRIARGGRDGRTEPRAKRVHVVRPKQGEVPRPRGRVEALEPRQHPIDLGQPERRRQEGAEVLFGVLQVAFDPHRSEQEETEVDSLAVRGKLVLQRAARPAIPGR